MAVQYCEYCDKFVDLDYNVEHFDKSGNCIIEKDEDKITKDDNEL